MRYLSGVAYAPCLSWESGGLMLTPEMGNRPNLTGVTWAADNGCYTAGERFSRDKFLHFLDRMAGQGNCVFAVAPDVPFNMVDTLDRSLPYVPLIRERGYPVALAIQEGVSQTGVPWDDCDAVFIAGRKAFKHSATAYAIAHEAQRRGKHVHIARQNSYRAVQAAYDIGADTVDGTFLAFAPDHNWQRMLHWFERFCTHEQLRAWSNDDRFGVCEHCGQPVRRRECDSLVALADAHGWFEAAPGSHLESQATHETATAPALATPQSSAAHAQPHAKAQGGAAPVHQPAPSAPTHGEGPALHPRPRNG